MMYSIVSEISRFGVTYEGLKPWRSLAVSGYPEVRFGVTYEGLKLQRRCANTLTVQMRFEPMRV